MRLRPKVLSGFLVLALMLSLAGAWSIYELRSISSTVQDLMEDNYKSVHAGKKMIEALEREDSGILLLMLGKWEEGRTIVESADSLFRAELAIAATNVTIAGEAAHIEKISADYQTYKKLWEMPIVDTQREGDLNWYFDSTHRAFLTVKASVDELININDMAMFETASNLRQGASRAVMPGLVAIVAALVFSLMFNYFVNIFVVGPIVRITEGVRRSLRQQKDFDIQIETKDELAELAESISVLVAQSRTAERRSTTKP
jgi:methyl-accepting chemotaxis protein